MGSVDIVIVAYRSAELLSECLDSIVAAARTSGQHHVESVVVVDNASPDSSRDVAQRHAVGATVVTSEKNLGFGRACNLGTAASSAPFVFFLNPDARIEGDALPHLIDQLELHPAVGAVGPAIVDPAGSYRAASAGYEPGLRSVLGHYLLFARIPALSRWFLPLQLPGGSTERCTDWVSGGAMMVRRAAFDQAGGFDPDYFLYMEDVDLCRRLREHGWSIVYDPRSVVLHQLGGTQGREQPARWARAFHSYVLRRHGSGYARLCAGLAAVGLAIRALAYMPRRRALSVRLARASREFMLAALCDSGIAAVAE